MLVQISPVISSTLVSMTIGYAIGLPVSKYFESNIRMRLLIAPVIGLGIFGAAGVSVFHLLPLTASNLILIVVALFAVALWLSKGAIEPLFRSPTSPSLSWLAVAFLLCLLPTFAIIPQHYGESVGVGYPIWDHAKIAIVNEIAQNGLPPANPFPSRNSAHSYLLLRLALHRGMFVRRHRCERLGGRHCAYRPDGIVLDVCSVVAGGCPKQKCECSVVGTPALARRFAEVNRAICLRKVA
ncbi:MULTISPECIES: hypothetical protein [Rhizobium]|uniref:hypothetical protein n=1 Tax=Rhizobium TaxID=379 RepID=UPI000AEF7E7E|nr:MULTISPECIES: hypothetical protein [Rhizobium]